MHGKIAYLLNLPLPRLLALPYGWVYLLVIFISVPVALKLHLLFADYPGYTPDNEWLLVIFGGLCILSYIVFYFILALFFPNYYDKHSWTLRKELCNLLYFFATALLVNGIFLWHTIPLHPDNRTFILFVGYVSFSYNLMPVVGITAIKNSYYFARKRRLYKEYKPELPESTPELPESIPELTESTPELTESIPEEGVLDLRSQKGKLYRYNDLAFFHVNGNYTEIHAYENNELRKDLLQISLVAIENLLPAHAQFVRCHSAFIVNTCKITSYIGSKRQRKLKIAGSKTYVDVSYKHADEITAILKKTKNNFPVQWQ